MAIEESQVPIFLGVSRRAARRGVAWDLLGLSNLVAFTFLPQQMSGLQLVVALPRALVTRAEGFTFRVLLTDANDPSIKGWADQTIGLAAETPDADTDGRFSLGPNSPVPASAALMLTNSNEPGAFELMALPAPPLFLKAPGRLFVDIVVDGVAYRRGEIICGMAVPRPLTDEERRAIASRPRAGKSILVQIGCKECPSKLSVFDVLDRNAPRPSKIPVDAIAIAAAPDSWTCGCGKTTTGLTYLKAGIHEMFRRPVTSRQSGLELAPLYEAGRIADILAQYEQLIERCTEEEPIQQFLQSNPLFWGFLAPDRILHKPAVLTKKKADFAVLSAQKVLYLIEIEKPSTKLTNADGAISAEIQKGANQIRDWQGVIADHRLAFLSEIGLKEGEVQEIRYVLIGGLARRSPPEGLTKIRRTPFAANTDFYCFDELGSFLHSVSAELTTL